MEQFQGKLITNIFNKFEKPFFGQMLPHFTNF